MAIAVPVSGGWSVWRGNREPQARTVSARPLRLLCSNNGSVLGSSDARRAEQPWYAHLRKGNFGDEPYREVPGRGKFYLDELDVLTMMDPPKNLVALEGKAYNHALQLWNKIEKVPQQRRARLLELVYPRLIEKTWDMAGIRYDDPRLFKSDAFNSLPSADIEPPFTVKRFKGKLAGEVWPFTWIRDVTMDFFVGADNAIYGRLGCGGLFGALLGRLYFKVGTCHTVPVTDDECDMVLEFGDGQLHLKDCLPSSFSRPAKAGWPLGDTQLYVRPVGPGVLVAQLRDLRRDPKQAAPKCLAKLMLIESLAASSSINPKETGDSDNSSR